MEDRFCPVCKNKIKRDVVTCAFCGAPLEPEADGQAPVTTVPIASFQPELVLRQSERLQHLAEFPADALILYVTGDDQPLVVPGLRSMVLGRKVPDAPADVVDLSKYEATNLGVSRQHVQIDFTEAYTITDLGTTNGTWLTQKSPQPHRPYPLRSGSEVRLGSLRLSVYYRQGEAEAGEVVIMLGDAPSDLKPHPPLTVAYLTEVLEPYLAALVDLQKGLDELQGLQPRAVVINTISAMRPELPIGVGLTGAAQALLLIKNCVIPWRVEHAVCLSDLWSGWPLPGGSVSPSPATTVIFDTPQAGGAVRRAPAEQLRADLPLVVRRAADELAGCLPAANWETIAQKLSPALGVLATSRLQLVLLHSKTEPVETLV